MATLPATVILTAIREVIEDAHGSNRTITADTYRGDASETRSASAEATRALEKPQAEPRITMVERHPQTPPEPGSFRLVKLGVEVRLIRPVPGAAQITASLRDAIRGAAATDADLLRQALMWPGNLTATVAGTNTGLVSGMLTWLRSTANPIESDPDGTAGRLVTTHTFEGVARVNQ